MESIYQTKKKAEGKIKETLQQIQFTCQFVSLSLTAPSAHNYNALLRNRKNWISFSKGLLFRYGNAFPLAQFSNDKT